MKGTRKMANFTTVAVQDWIQYLGMAEAKKLAGTTDRKCFRAQNVISADDELLASMRAAGIRYEVAEGYPWWARTW
jgi:hypothetical protein